MQTDQAKYLITFMIKISQRDLEHLKESMHIILPHGEIILKIGNTFKTWI